MKNAAKNLVLSFTLALLAARVAVAQTSGRINYEATQRVDLSQVRIIVNGQQIKPGSPDFPADIPESRSFGMTLSFAGTAAKEERENAGMVLRTVEGGPGGGGVPQQLNIPRPVQESTYLDLANRSSTTVLTVKKDETATTYRSD